MLKILTVVFILGLPFAVEAQFYLAPHFDYERSQLQGFDANDFFRSYNAYYGNNMAEPMDTLLPGEFSHPNWGGALRVFLGEQVAFTSGLLIAYGRARTRHSGRFRNGIVTQTDWEVRDLKFQYDIGICLGRALSLTTHLGGHVRNTIMDLGYVYQDGTYSLGNEYDILSVFKATTVTLDYGFGLALRLKSFYFPLTISFPSNAFSDEGLLTLVDFDERQIRWTDLPRDFETWANDPSNLDLETGFVRANSFRSMRIAIGIEYFLGSSANQR